jgi:hypothetical protein
MAFPTAIKYPGIEQMNNPQQKLHAARLRFDQTGASQVRFS